MAGQMLIEVTELADLDLESTPPCECVLEDFFPNVHICGRPSVIRVRTECTGCGMVGTAFYC